MFFGLLMSIFYLKNPHKGKKQKGFFYVFPLSCIHSCHRTLNYQIHKSQRVARVLQPSFHRVTRCKSMPPNSFIVQFFSNFSKNFFNFSLQKLFLQNRLRDLRIRLRKKHFCKGEFRFLLQVLDNTFQILEETFIKEIVLVYTGSISTNKKKHRHSKHQKMNENADGNKVMNLYFFNCSSTNLIISLPRRSRFTTFPSGANNIICGIPLTP